LFISSSCNSSKEDFTCFEEADQYVYVDHSSADTTVSGSDLDSGADINVDANTDADTDADTDANTDADTDADTNANTDTDTNTDINVDVNTANGDAYSRHCLQKGN
jgi:hypothetical protein